MLDHLLLNNRNWAAGKTRLDPDFFNRLTQQQSPEYFWIGCADSRVPANEIVNLDPGEMFVHRNVANLAPQQDANYLSVLQYAVHALKVKHVLVVGHYGCGGVRTAVESTDHGLIDHWLTPIRDTANAHREELARCEHDSARLNRLCELNVIAQVRNVATNPITMAAWRDNQPLTVHGWVYSLANGLVNDLGVSVSGFEDRLRIFDV
jgi:carbonic anhydrase